MGRRKQQFLKLFGYIAISENGDLLGTSQAAGDLEKVESSFPGSKIRDKNGQICTQPMTSGKRKRILAWLSKKR